MTAPTESKNGRVLSNDQRRAAEVAICDGPLPSPLPEDEERELFCGDATLAETMAKQRVRCHGNHPGGRCSPVDLCSECRVARLYTALAWHRRRYGRALHPREVAGYLPEREGDHGELVGSKDDAKPIIVPMDQVQALPVSWFWHYRMPRGAVTLLDGDPDLGKTTIAIDLAARTSRGWEMPPYGGPCEGAEPESVLILSAEDDVARTIRPRLDAAGADVSRIYFLDTIKEGDTERPPVLPADLERVEEFIKDRNIKLVIIDPFMAYLGDADSHKDQDIRRCMHALKNIAERTGAAFLVIRHLNKMVSNAVALYRGGGSIGIIGASRAAMVVGRDPENPHTRVLAWVKSNLGPKPKSLVYEMTTAGDVARIGWGGETDLTADEIIQHVARKRKKKADDCAKVIADMLAKGPMASEDFAAALKGLGFTEHAIKTARKKLGVVAKRDGFGSDGRFMVFSAEDVAAMKTAEAVAIEGGS